MLGTLKDWIITILMLYVDDIIMIRNDKLEIENLKQPLVIEFRIKDLRALRYFIEIEVPRS